MWRHECLNVRAVGDLPSVSELSCPLTLVLCHGGPKAEPEDAAWINERTRDVTVCSEPLPSSGTPLRPRSPCKREASNPFVQRVNRSRWRGAMVESKSRQVKNETPGALLLTNN
jgi:hypothetical protein